MDNSWNDSSGNGNNGIPMGSDLTPRMTSDTTPSPYAVTASSFGAPYTPYKAFDHTKRRNRTMGYLYDKRMDNI